MQHKIHYPKLRSDNFLLDKLLHSGTTVSISSGESTSNLGRCIKNVNWNRIDI